MSKRLFIAIREQESHDDVDHRVFKDTTEHEYQVSQGKPATFNNLFEELGAIMRPEVLDKPIH